MDILSFILGLQKGKSMGGGSSADVRYVTFIGADGTVLYKKPVAVGDDCVDVVAKGLISTPTKEMTVAEVYTYSGWSLIEGGAASSSALKSVAEDRTVYAAFTTSARKYTVRFLDGDTVMKTEQVVYGTQATPPNTTKEGYAFVSWTPSNLTIYGDTDFVGTWKVDGGWLAQLEFTEDTATSSMPNMVYSPDGTRLFATSSTNLYMYDATKQPYEKLCTIQMSDPASDMAISPDGSMLAISGNVTSSVADKNLQIYTIGSTSLTKQNNLPTTASSISNNKTYSLVFAPDGSKLYLLRSAGMNGAVWECDTNTWALTEVASCTYSVTQSRRMAISPDGTKLFVPYQNNHLSKNYYLFDLTNNYADVTATYLGTRATASGCCAEYSPDGRYLAVGFINNNVKQVFKVYDTSTTPYAVIMDNALDSKQVYDVAFSADGTLLFAMTQNSPYIHAFEVGTWTKQDAPLALPTGAAWRCALNNDTTRLAVGHANAPYMTLYEIRR